MSRKVMKAISIRQPWASMIAAILAVNIHSMANQAFLYLQTVKYI